jgi:regulatory protein
LERRQVPPEVAREVLDRFEEVDLVDDEAFAQAWVRSRHGGRGLARRALSHELRMRGVADEVVREAVEAVRPEDELERAKDLVRRRLRSAPVVPGSGVERARQIRRLMGMLARRGYRTDQAGRAVREVLSEVGLDPDEV